MDVFGPAIPHFLFESASHKVEPALVEVVAKLVCSRHPNHDGRSVRNHPKLLFALSQRHLSVLTFSDVAGDGELHERFIWILERSRMRFHMPARAFESKEVKL